MLSYKAVQRGKQSPDNAWHDNLLFFAQTELSAVYWGSHLFSEQHELDMKKTAFTSMSIKFLIKLFVYIIVIVICSETPILAI
jgi:hypothetical protein